MPPGRYRFGPQETGSWFESDGRVGFVPGLGLASSVVGLDTMVRTMKSATKATLPEVVRMASLTPARRAGIARNAGSLEVGKRADVLVLNRAWRSSGCLSRVGSLRRCSLTTVAIDRLEIRPSAHRHVAREFRLQQFQQSLHAFGPVGRQTP